MALGSGELMPCRGITKASWRLIKQQASPKSLSGSADTLELGPPYWQVDIVVTLPSRGDFDLWEGFIERRDGSAETFVMPRTFRAKPRDAAVASDAGLTITALDSVAKTISIAGVGSWAAKEGDMISYKTVAGGYWIGRLQADATPVAGTVGLSVTPAPRLAHATPEIKRIEALGEFRLLGQPKFNEGHVRRSLKLKAEQVIL